MAKTLKPLPVEGDKEAVEIFARVGFALSHWENSEDAMLALYRDLTERNEPLALEAYIAAPRKVRLSMLRSAIQSNLHLFEGEETKIVEASLRGLDTLASKRNEIAHGAVRGVSSNVNGVSVASGNYLLPSSSETGRFERNVRFHYTSATIHEFTESVRDHAWAIRKVQLDVGQRLNTVDNLRQSGVGRDLIDVARKLVRYEIKTDEAVEQMKEIFKAEKLT